MGIGRTCNRGDNRKHNKEAKGKNMKLNTTVRANYRGYELQGYARSLLPPEKIRKYYTKLERVPAKISAFIDRSTIAEAYKYTDWYYFIIDTDGYTFVLDY